MKMPMEQIQAWVEEQSSRMAYGEIIVKFVIHDRSLRGIEKHTNEKIKY